MDRHIIQVRPWSLPNAGGEAAGPGYSQERSGCGISDVMIDFIFSLQMWCWHGVNCTRRSIGLTIQNLHSIAVRTELAKDELQWEAEIPVHRIRVFSHKSD